MGYDLLALYRKKFPGRDCPKETLAAENNAAYNVAWALLQGRYPTGAQVVSSAILVQDPIGGPRAVQRGFDAAIHPLIMGAMDDIREKQEEAIKAKAEEKKKKEEAAAVAGGGEEQ